MPMKLFSADEFRAAAKDGQRPEGTVFRFATTEPQDVAARTKRFVFSDATVDHSDDSIDPKGWNLSIFKRNPVALFSHMSWEPPIGRASNVKVEGSQLVGDIEFASADVYPFADTIYRLVDGKFLNAVSVGFKPDEWAFSSDKNRPYGIDFKKQTLLEISVCPVPCNPNALTEARSAGVDTRPLVEWAERVLDSGDTVFLPRKDLESLRTQANGGGPVEYYISGDREAPLKGIERMRESFKRWREDPNEILILEPGYALRRAAPDVAPLAAPEPAAELGVDGQDDTALESAIAEAVKAPTPESIRKVAQLAKAGRRVSAATRAKLQEALDHHAAGEKCIKDAMDGCPDDEPDADDEKTLDPAQAPEPTEPPAAAAVQDLTPEEKRLAEVAAIKATLPTAEA